MDLIYIILIVDRCLELTVDGGASFDLLQTACSSFTMQQTCTGVQMDQRSRLPSRLTVLPLILQAACCAGCNPLYRAVIG